jgi:ATP/maltotriose-dependent transcriptional regulator MalT
MVTLLVLLACLACLALSAVGSAMAMAGPGRVGRRAMRAQRHVDRDPAGARRLALKALAQPDLPDRVAAGLLGTIASADVLLGDLTQAAAHHREAVERARRSQRPPTLVVALNNLAWFEAAWCGDGSAARPAINEAMQLVPMMRPSASPMGLLALRGTELAVLVREGVTPDLLEQVRAEVARRRSGCPTRMRAEMLLEQAIAERALGDASRARATLDEAEALNAGPHVAVRLARIRTESAGTPA